MRTPNTSCLICAVPLYRRPGEIGRTRFAACMVHRAVAQKVAGVTDAQKMGLSLGREKGTNHRQGYRHRADSKAKVAAANKRFAAQNPEVIAARGEKVRGDRHYLWKGGTSRLNTSIRQMNENRQWMNSVKARDGRCLHCGATDDLEAHHLNPLADLIGKLCIRSRDDARRHAGVLWDLANGATLCRPCHYAEHGRKSAS